jgi:hypothetical protein
MSAYQEWLDRTREEMDMSDMEWEDVFNAGMERAEKIASSFDVTKLTVGTSIRMSIAAAIRSEIK